MSFLVAQLVPWDIDWTTWIPKEWLVHKEFPFSLSVLNKQEKQQSHESDSFLLTQPTFLKGKDIISRAPFAEFLCHGCYFFLPITSPHWTLTTDKVLNWFLTLLDRQTEVQRDPVNSLLKVAQIKAVVGKKFCETELESQGYSKKRVPSTPILHPTLFILQDQKPKCPRNWPRPSLPTALSQT